MLWVLKRTVSMRWFFWAPRTYVKRNGYENIHNFTLIYFLTGPLKDESIVLVIGQQNILFYDENILFWTIGRSIDVQLWKELYTAKTESKMNSFIVKKGYS